VDAAATDRTYLTTTGGGQVAVPLLAIAAVFQFFDGVQVTAIGRARFGQHAIAMGATWWAGG